MNEIASGLWDWTARHEHIGANVSSYYLESERVAIDPLLPSEGLEWLAELGPPEHVLLSNRHHDRHAWRLRDAFGCTVHCIHNGLHELEGRGPAEAFEFGDELPGVWSCSRSMRSALMRPRCTSPRTGPSRARTVSFAYAMARG